MTQFTHSGIVTLLITFLSNVAKGVTGKLDQEKWPVGQAWDEYVDEIKHGFEMIGIRVMDVPLQFECGSHAFYVGDAEHAVLAILSAEDERGVLRISLGVGEGLIPVDGKLEIEIAKSVTYGQLLRDRDSACLQMELADNRSQLLEDPVDERTNLDGATESIGTAHTDASEAFPGDETTVAEHRTEAALAAGG